MSTSNNHNVYTFPRAEGEEVRIGIREYKNQRYLDLRIWFQASAQEEFRPTKKGICLDLGQMPHLTRGVQELSQAVEKFRRKNYSSVH